MRSMTKTYHICFGLQNNICFGYVKTPIHVSSQNDIWLWNLVYHARDQNSRQ